MNRVDRLFSILTLLQSRKYVTAEKIAEKFDMSIRTVYRDLKALCESGVPISFEPKKGYCIVEGYFLQPLSFSTEEANALLLMEAVTYGFADKSIQTHYASAVNKVRAVLKSSQKEKAEILANNMKLQIPACYAQNSDYLSLFQNAIISKMIVELHYKNNNNEVSKRDIEPIGLIFYAFSWHLIAWCHMRNDYRDFKLTNILKIKNTEIPFTRTNHIELNDYMKLLPVDF